MEINGEYVNGIFVPKEEDYFHHQGCDNCGNGLACDVSDVKCHTDKTGWNDHYEVQLCDKCILMYFYGDKNENSCKNLLKI